jgi:hypothetical protein
MNVAYEILNRAGTALHIVLQGENPAVQDGHESDNTDTIHARRQYGV